MYKQYFDYKQIHTDKKQKIRTIDNVVFSALIDFYKWNEKSTPIDTQKFIQKIGGITYFELIGCLRILRTCEVITPEYKINENELKNITFTQKFINFLE